jgi:hypothetical protein
MSLYCGTGNTRSNTLAAEAEAAAAGTQLDNETLLNLLLERLNVGVNPSPTAADVTWPDEEHIASARLAIENPFLVVPTQRMRTTLCVGNAVFLPHPHWLSRPRDLY